MAGKITIEELLARNKTVMASHKPAPTFQFLTENQIAVAKTLVVACADPRSDPSYILGLNFGDCGSTHFTNEKVREVLTQRDLQAAAEMKVESVDFGAVSNLRNSVVTDIKFLKESKLIREELKEDIKGYLYDIENGGLEEISG
ncbi:hypothetical protein LZ31DRAFT_586343 [Colletotrichum somersetense]|nr:hypothetical protein LZ31DRAFT_586343 [Colletotrichum somersetense]